MKITCRECGQTLPETEFWEVRIGRNEHKRFDKCKQCCLKSIDIYDYKSIIPLLKELNFPYIQEDLSKTYQYYWDKDPSCRTAIGRYLSKMKLMSFRSYTFEDSEEINKINEERKREAMRRRGFNV